MRTFSRPAPRRKAAPKAPLHRPLAFAIVFLSVLLFGAVATAQYFPNLPGHPLSQVYIPSLPGGAPVPPGGRISVDANLNSMIDNADLATTAVFAQTAGALGGPPGTGTPTPSTQLLTRGCQPLLALTTGTAPPVPIPLPTASPAAQCIDGVCHLVLREVPTTPGVTDTSIYTFFQSSADNYWVADGQNPQAPNPIPSRNYDGLNGDAVFGPIANHNSILLTDDSAAEQSPAQLSLWDQSASHDAELWLCSS